MVIGRGRRREHPNDTSKGVTWPRSLRVLRNFRLRMRTLNGTPKWIKWPSVTYGSHVTTVLLLRKTRGEKRGMRRIFFRSGPLLEKTSSGHVTFSLPIKSPHQGGYCATSGCACAQHTSGQGTWLTSLPVTSLPVMRNGPILRTILHKYDLSCTHILLQQLQ